MLKENKIQNYIMAKSVWWWQAWKWPWKLYFCDKTNFGTPSATRFRKCDLKLKYFELKGKDTPILEKAYDTSFMDGADGLALQPFTSQVGTHVAYAITGNPFTV